MRKRSCKTLLVVFAVDEIRTLTLLVEVVAGVLHKLIEKVLMFMMINKYCR